MYEKALNERNLKLKMKERAGPKVFYGLRFHPPYYDSVQIKIGQ